VRPGLSASAVVCVAGSRIFKLFSTRAQVCALALSVLAVFGLASCGVDDTGHGWDGEITGGRITVPQNAPASLSARHNGKISAVTSDATASTAAPSLAPLLGNVGAIVVPVNAGVALQRQADCSLLFSNFTGSVAPSAITTTFESQTPHYEKTMRDNAFLTTPADTFPNGCVDQALGTTSRIALYLGTGKSGQLIGAGLSSGNLYAGTLNSANVFSTPVKLVTDLPPLSIMFGDLNKDGNQDLISINDDGLNSSVDVSLGKGDGTFQAPAKIALPGAIAQFGVVDDMNGDGKLDIVLGVSTRGVFQFLIYLGNGSGGFAAPVGFSPNQADLSFATTFITADVNGDNHKDIVTSEGQVLLGQASGTNFTLAPQSFSGSANTTNMYAPGMVAADFNNDHKLDLAVDDGVTIRIFFGNGDGTFSAGPAYSTIANRGLLVAADLDGDGSIDLFTGYGNSGFFGADDFFQNIAYALLGNGDGTFQGAPTLPFKYTGTNLLDLNGDGRPDLVGLIVGSTETTLTTFLTGANGVPVAGPQLVIPNGVSLDSYALGAFNSASAFPSLLYLTASPQVQTFNLAAGVGDGSFHTPVSFPVPTLVPTGNDINESLTGLRVADFDHDGKLDVAYSFSDQASDTQIFYEGFAVQLGNGDGTFQAPKITLTYQSATAPLAFPANMLSGIQDVNNDNFPDVFMVVPAQVLNAPVPEQVQLFIANGDGTFKVPTTPTLLPNIRPSTPDGVSGSPFAFADLNGDGKMDVVASGSSADGTIPQVAIALGNGDGTFKPPTILVFQGFGFPAGPALAKFTGTGKLDLYVGDSTGLGIYPGNGDGTFQTIANGDGTVSPPQRILLSVGTGSVAADLDNDGAPDLIAGDVVLLNKTGKLVSPPAPDASKTALKVSASTVATGASVTFTVTVTSTASATIPTGTVSFLDGTTSLGTGALSSGAVATFSTTKLSAGPHSITAVYAGDGTFASSTSTAIAVTVGGGSSGDFTLAATPTSATVAKGGSATTALSLTATGGFNQQVSFACSGLPTGASCSFSPATVTPTGSTASTTTITISTSAGSAIVSPTSQHRWPLAPSTLFAVLLSLSALSGLLVSLLDQTWKLEFRLRFLASVLLLALTVLGFAGCGGSSGSASTGGTGTPSGSSTITITASAGSTSHTATFTLTVQ
jgi:hypothetical protein